MNIEPLKLDILEKFLVINKETVLEQINKILEKETIVAYTIKGEPLTKKEYNKNL